MVNSHMILENKDSIEFVDICEIYLGPLGKYVSLIVGVAAFVGAIVVYWVLMSNFLYKVGKFAHGRSNIFQVCYKFVHIFLISLN